MKTTAEQISAEVADYMATREAEKQATQPNAKASEGPVDFLALLRREWLEAGIIPAGADPLANKPISERTQPDVAALARKSRLGQFRGICPPEFCRPIDEGLLRCPLAAWRDADSWDGAHPGLWLHSAETGHAKTRMLWRQFGRLYVEKNKRCIKITGQAMAEEYFRYHMDGDPAAFYRWILSHDVILLDDLDKMDLGDKRAPRMCRELFDKMYEYHKPCLVTANEPIAHFQKRVGESMARRIRDVCREILF
jgi:hypothetical protein